MLDAQLVSAAISSRAAYEKVEPYITEKDMTPAAGFWWKIVREWYVRDPQANSVDKGVLWEQGKSRIGNPKHQDSLHGFLQELPSAVSPTNVASTALELRRFNVGMELGAASAGRDYAKARELVLQYSELLQATELKGAHNDSIIHAPPVEALWDAVGDDSRIPLSPAKVNAKLAGGALPGNHILVYGRTDVGKTTFVLNMAAGFVRRDERVLYFGNEDQIKTLKSRFVARLTGQTWQEAQLRKRDTERVYRERGGEERMRMIQITHTTPDKMRKEIAAYEPTVVFLDQIRNLQGANGDKMTQKLESAGIAFRELLLEHDLVGVSVTQANDRREKNGQEHPIWLDTDDVDSSRTGLPGTTDLMIGLGANKDMRMRGQIAASFPKNKLSSEPNAREGVILQIDLKTGIVS